MQTRTQARFEEVLSNNDSTVFPERVVEKPKFYARATPPATFIVWHRFSTEPEIVKHAGADGIIDPLFFSQAPCGVNAAKVDMPLRAPSLRNKPRVCPTCFPGLLKPELEAEIKGLIEKVTVRAR